MALVSTDHARHSTSTDVRVTLALGAGLRPTDAAAIASWYQTPRGPGAVFATLASGMPTDRDELLSAIGGEMSATDDPGTFAELKALNDWVTERGADYIPQSDPDDCAECSHGRISHGARGCIECACVGYDADADADY